MSSQQFYEFPVEILSFFFLLLVESLVFIDL